MLELLVGLTLTTLIVTMAYFSYNYLFSGFVKYRGINEHIATHCTAKNYLDYLVAHSEEIGLKRGDLLFKMGPEDTKKVHVTENYLLFETAIGSTDTVWVGVKAQTCYWKNDSLLKESSPVQKIKLLLQFSGTEHSLIFDKVYDSETLIRLDSAYNALQ